MSSNSRTQLNPPTQGYWLRGLRGLRAVGKAVVGKVIPQTPAKLSDPQTAIWNAVEAGDVQTAQRLRAELIARMQNETIVSKKFKNIGGDQGAVLVTFQSKIQGIMKRKIPFWQSPGAEVAAYKLSVFLDDFVNVPVTVYRIENNTLYSIQFFIPNSGPAVKNQINGAYLQNLRFFDYLNDNHDREELENGEIKNLLSGGVAIDNGIGYRTGLFLTPGEKPVDMVTSPETSWSLFLAGCCSANPQRTALNMRLVRRMFLASLPERSIYEKVKATPDDVFFKLFSEDLSTEDIHAFIRRKDFFIQVVEQWLEAGNTYPTFLSRPISNPTTTP